MISVSLKQDKTFDRQLQFLWSDESNLRAPDQREIDIDEYWFTGGVGALMLSCEKDDSLTDARLLVDDFVFDDMGVLLARALTRSLKGKRLAYKIPENAIRATVIGAGHNSVQLTGSTIGISSHEKPLKNIRIIRPSFNADESALKSISKILKEFEHNWVDKPFAIVLDNHKLFSRKISFYSLRSLAEDLAQAVRELNASPPTIFLARFDIAMALGQLLKELLPDERVIVLDGHRH